MARAKKRSPRHIVITGAGSGIGRAIAMRFAKAGEALTLVGRNQERLDAVAIAATRAGAHKPVVVAACDVRRKRDVASCLASAAAEVGPFDVVVANAGIGGPNGPQGRDRFDDLVATNLTATYHFIRAALRHLEQGPEARHVVVTSSILARIGVAGYTGYCASKAGLLGLVRALAMELAPQNVQVNAVCPGWVNTDMARAGIEGIAKAIGGSYDDALKVAMQDVPLGRMGEPEDVAGLVAWLVSADARGVTGQGLDINGGAFMH